MCKLQGTCNNGPVDRGNRSFQTSLSRSFIRGIQILFPLDRTSLRSIIDPGVTVLVPMLPGSMLSLRLLELDLHMFSMVGMMFAGFLGFSGIFENSFCFSFSLRSPRFPSFYLLNPHTWNICGINLQILAALFLMFKETPVYKLVYVIIHV